MASLNDMAQSALDKLRPTQEANKEAPAIPGDVKDRLKRGADRLQEVTARRQEAIEFTANNHYVSIASSGTTLNRQSLVPINQGGDKPNHRVRRSHDLLAPILKSKISAATQRIPSYEVLPATSDPEDYSAARTAKNVAVAGYEIWDLKTAFRRLVWYALVTEEGFIMPYWDSSVGPFVELAPENPEEPPKVIGMGEVKAAVYGGLEVIWEPGVRFEDSPWLAIEHARPKDQVEKEQGFLGTPLKADAATKGRKTGPSQSAHSNLVIVTEYLERPCPQYPEGRRQIFANGRQVFPTESYPLRDHEGNVVDAPCLHRISYALDANSDRDRGLVPSLVESIRSYDYASNKADEHLQLVLIPQLLAPEGAITNELTDRPGSVIEYDPLDLQGGRIEWREMPSMPNEFSNERDRAEKELGTIASENNTPTQIESGRAIDALYQKDALAWQDFIEDLATVHSRFMRDALSLVQLYYTEDRLVKFRGRTGWESIQDFKGADIRGQTDVRVSPASLEPLTRGAIEQRIMNLSSMFPGHWPPEVLIGALESVSVDKLNQSYEEDEARVNFIIQQIRNETLFDLPPRPLFPGEEVPRLNQTGEVEWQVPPQTNEAGEIVVPGKPLMETELPGWMPRPFDGIPVHKMRMETFMKSDEWNHLSPQAQSASIQYYNALLQEEAKTARRTSELQTAKAEQLGMENAARPQEAKPLPSLPAVNSSEGEES